MVCVPDTLAETGAAGKTHVEWVGVGILAPSPPSSQRSEQFRSSKPQASKLQKSSKSQAPKRRAAPGARSAAGWSLVLGVVLELGAWSLELGVGSFTPSGLRFAAATRPARNGGLGLR
jgi:hypothetical protein